VRPTSLIRAALGLMAWSWAAAPLPAQIAGISDHATARLGELETRNGTDQAPQDMMLRNLSRYFVRYLLPSEAEEMSRVVGTAERMTARAATGLFATLQAGARQAGLDVVPGPFVDGLMERVLPSETNAWGEVIFFPERPPAGRPIVEAVDLRAFSDTGFAWQILAAIEPAAFDGAPGTVPLTPEAIDAFQRGINAYALLLLRVAGLHAKLEHAPYVQTFHLREAGKTLTAEGEATALQPPIRVAAAGPFTEVTGESGLDFRHVSSDWLAEHRRYGTTAPTFSGGGVSAADLDGDGWDDLVLCGGRGCAAFRNRHDGTFEDVTAASGLRIDGEARMAVVADLDNDGDRDIFVTYARDTNRLFENDGSGVFRDVTSASGLERPGDISGPAVAVDVDGDALLDLYVGNFGDYLAGATPWQFKSADNAQPNRLFRNLGGLRFTDASQDAGVGDTGWTQALSHCDVDRDGDQDLYIANDFGRNELLLNDGRGHFKRAGAATGSDDEHHGMNVSWVDLNHDRLADIFVTNIWSWSTVDQVIDESNTLLLSQPGDGEPTYRRYDEPTFLAYDTGWSWAATFFDYDLDGDDDVFIANGFTDYLTFTQMRPNPDVADSFYPTNNGNEPNWLLRQDAGMRFVTVESSVALDGVNSRAAALLDYDHDGDLDLAVTTFHGPAHLFRNDAPRAGGGWLTVELVGDPGRGANRDAVGAQVTATDAAGLEVWRTVTAGDAYLSQQSLPVEIGLGAASAVDLEILWPGGESQRLPAVGANQWIRVRQGVEGFERLH
jgi:enediyne biosynthesis protein E4